MRTAVVKAVLQYSATIATTIIVVTVIVVGCCPTLSGQNFMASINSADAAESDQPPPVKIHSKAVVHLVLQLEGSTLILPEGWEVLNEIPGTLVCGHQHQGLVTVERVLNAHLELIDVATENDSMIKCSASSWGVTCETRFSTGENIEQEGNSLLKRITTVRTVGSDYIIWIEVPIGINPTPALALAGDLGRILQEEN